MGDHKHIFCRKGLHRLEPGNLYFDARGNRQCRECHLTRCKNAQRVARARIAPAKSDADLDREALKWLEVNGFRLTKKSVEKTLQPW